MEKNMKKIVIGVPLVNKNIHPDFVKSLVGSVYAGAKSDVEFFVDFESGNSLIEMNANVIANRVKSSEVVDGVVFLSPSLSWSPASLEALINHDKDVMSGVFPEAVTFEEVYNVKLLEDQDIQGEDLKAEYVNMQACYISKEALVKAAEHSPSSSNGTFTFFFTPKIEDGLYTPGYVGLCQALIKAGVDINVEKTANFGNIGEIKFDGNYEKLIQKHWVEDQALMQDIERGLIELQSENEKGAIE
jgi:hypothetical protein